jgi:hypothetical protein
VVAADRDGSIATTFHGDPVSNSLESLVAEKKTNAVKLFVATRKVIRDLQKDFAGHKLEVPRRTMIRFI